MTTTQKTVRDLVHGDRVAAGWRTYYRNHYVVTVRGWSAQCAEMYGVRDETPEQAEQRAVANGHEIHAVSPEPAIMDGTVKVQPSIVLERGEYVRIEGVVYAVDNHPSAREHLYLKPVPAVDPALDFDMPLMRSVVR